MRSTYRLSWGSETWVDIQEDQTLPVDIDPFEYELQQVSQESKRWYLQSNYSTHVCINLALDVWGNFTCTVNKYWIYGMAFYDRFSQQCESTTKHVWK